MKERWPEMLEYQQKVQAMTDLERARWLLPDGTDEVEVRELAEVIAAARREGAEAEREKVAMWMIMRSIPTGHGDTVEDLLAELRAVVADEMRERAAAATTFCCFECSRVIRALPLTPEAPVAMCCQGDVPLSECSLYPDHCTPEEPT